MKKLIVMLMFAVMVCFGAMPAMAQLDYNDEEAVMAALAKEPPLTQADIDKFVTNFGELDKAAQSDNEAAFLELSKKIGWNEARVIYVPLKVGIAWSLEEDADSAAILEAMFPPELMPTAAEKELVKKNMANLAPIFEE